MIPIGDSIKFVITQNEWNELPLSKRTKIKSILLDEYGYDISGIDEYNEEEEDV
jgi:hypothetical protein